ncbi:16S rRNA (cytidine(1402)-2'-O)-methyltransferase [Robbsia sp. Bb-Pol-6]|uniref:Ribosomal RNA small subunit methyltransferase I n=1 Tax=Robbsia betulipollinis TaxID=2981849 RepID=A0ABT3ZU19_9BURK|nr:16S rRNA (cytidine(1402)-2'-O)-methyltransferase [Robbsia betulipollinis]MCY0389715.1 16S rRNA (cytidine(1402)-2'-O)-methyltransferase [Robbsia betulipollinis]
MTDPLALASSQHYPPATLYMVATPIGNVADISLRALHLLGLCDRLAAEDTRNTAQLLSRYGIAKPMIAAHDHNENEAAERIVAFLAAGERVAFVSDAGTPGISDPGGRLVEAARAAGYGVMPLPGASAVTTAISAAGAWASTFTFVGFLASKTKQRAGQLDALAGHPHAIVLYEAPHRIEETMRAARDALGGTRRVLIARELTKLHESIHRATLAEGPEWLARDANHRRGEFVLVIEGAPAPGDGERDAAAHDGLLRALLDELPVSAAARVAARISGVSRGVLYARALQLAGNDSDEEAADGENAEGSAAP